MSLNDEQANFASENERRRSVRRSANLRLTHERIIEENLFCSDRHGDVRGQFAEKLRQFVQFAFVVLNVAVGIDEFDRLRRGLSLIHI